MIVDSCSFLPCDQVEECSLVGGCIEKRSTTRAAVVEGRSFVQYNPMMGTRLDLLVHDEPTADAAKRWDAARRKYLGAILKNPALDADDRARYQSELDVLTNK
jgi:hypothetical protein